MVQTEQQYVCIHQCLLAVLEGKEHLLADSLELHANDGYEGELEDLFFFGQTQILFYSPSFYLIFLYFHSLCGSSFINITC